MPERGLPPALPSPRPPPWPEQSPTVPPVPERHFRLHCCAAALAGPHLLPQGTVCVLLLGLRASSLPS